MMKAKKPFENINISKEKQSFLWIKIFNWIYDNEIQEADNFQSGMWWCCYNQTKAKNILWDQMTIKYK